MINELKEPSAVFFHDLVYKKFVPIVRFFSSLWSMFNRPLKRWNPEFGTIPFWSKYPSPRAYFVLSPPDCIKMSCFCCQAELIINFSQSTYSPDLKTSSINPLKQSVSS